MAVKKALERGHDNADGAIRNENQPEKLVEEGEVRTTLVDEAPLWKSDENGSEDDVEGGRILKENLEA